MRFSAHIHIKEKRHINLRNRSNIRIRTYTNFQKNLLNYFTVTKKEILFKLTLQ